MLQLVANDNHAFMLRSFFQMNQSVERFRQGRDTAYAVAGLGRIGDLAAFFKRVLQLAKRQS